MAKTNEIMEQVTNGGKELAKPANTLNSLLARVDVKKRFEEMLGQKAAGFISSIISVANADKKLQAVDPKSILQAAVIAATMDLPINKNLGFAWIIPYKDRAEFQMGYKGFVQLAIRSGQYKTMNAAEIYTDEVKRWNPITGEIEFAPAEEWKMRSEGKRENIIGYVAFFRLINGFEKYLYMTTWQIDQHARRYSQSFSNPNSKWQTDKHAMSLKTVLKLLLSKYGILSIEMQRAIQVDQAVIVDAGKDKESEPTLEFMDAEVSQGTETAADKEAGTAQE